MGLEHLVVEGYISNDGWPYVILTTSLRPSTQEQNIGSHLVRWGKVTIYDGKDSVVLVGGVDPKVYPPFSYRTYNMRGNVGGTYTLHAEYAGMHAWAKGTILSPPVISGYEVSKDEDSDSLCCVSVSVERPANSEGQKINCVAFVKELDGTNRNEADYLPCFMGIGCIEPEENCLDMSIYKPRAKMLPTFGEDEKYVPNYKLGDTLQVMVSRVDDTVYDFWWKYQNQIAFGHSLFVSTSQSLVGNIVGGYGCFTVRGSNVIRIPVSI